MALVVNGDGNITGLTPGGLPDASITQADLAANIAGNGPAFSVYRSSGQTLSGNVTTKLQLNAKDYDTNTNFDATTNYRYLPTVAGYYFFVFGGFAQSSTNGVTLNFVELYKNGSPRSNSIAKAGSYTYTPSYAYYDGTAGGTALEYMNGTTDYVELYGRITGGGTLSYGQCYLQGLMIRAA